ncbi:MAG: hypothetical protein QOF74_6196, partial [Caballeronia mineralivorans]|nr:hypothetical protein [Caballeronia mineralivorans]
MPDAGERRTRNTERAKVARLVSFPGIGAKSLINKLTKIPTTL